MAQTKQVYCYSPDGLTEGWYFENEIPEGYLRTSPKSLEDEKVKDEAGAKAEAKAEMDGQKQKSKKTAEK